MGSSTSQANTRDHNIIERRGAEGMFVEFRSRQVRLRPPAEDPGLPAIGAGNPAEAPPVDITGAPRGSRIDIGAYQHSPAK